MPSKIILEDDSGFLLQEGAGDFLLLEGTYFDDVRQNLIDGFVSAQSDTNGWNELRSTIALSSIVRTSNSVYTFTIPAIGAFNITQTHNITNIVPGVALVGGNPITATPTMTITISGGTFSLDCAPGSYILTGIAASIIAQRMINAASGSYSLTGFLASLVSNKMINAAPGSYSVSGVGASLVANRMINAGIGSYSITGVSASLLANRLVNAAPGVYSISGVDASFVYVPITGYAIDAAPGSYEVTGIATSLLADRLLVLSPGTYNLTGVAALITVERFINAAPGTYTIVGSVASTVVTRILSASPGVYNLTGIDANLVPTTGYILIAESGTYLITGYDTRGQLEFDVFPIDTEGLPTPCPQIVND